MPKRRKLPKLNPDQHRALVEEYNISFDGPIFPSQWPAQYEHIFQKIRDIQYLRFDEYGSDGTMEIPTVLQMKTRVLELTDIAHDCRRRRENEATWRAHTEPVIVSRFDAEVVCSICSGRLWISKFQALPNDLEDARTLQESRARRTICICDPRGRTDENSKKKRRIRCFANRSEVLILHDPAENLADRGIRPRLPDRVYGLYQTEELKKHTLSRQELRHSAFGDGEVPYPFLIIEAKSEKGSPGFQSIENQTAFPIRTLVKLQHDLSSASVTSLNPLVWFLANQGEDWRVYASISDGAKFRVINLWHGIVSSGDCALQLLLIIDYICDWAHDIYLPNILQCLAGGNVSIQALPATATSTTSQENASIVMANSLVPAHASASSPETFSTTISTPDSQAVDTEMQGLHFTEQEDEADMSIDLHEYHALLRYSIGQNGLYHWSRHATIRHSNLSIFSFRHFAVPEERKELEACLNSFRMDEGMKNAAQCLLELLSYKKAVTITMNGIHQLENLWTRKSRHFAPRHENPVRARILFHTFLRPQDWQVVRELSCVTGSQRATEELMKIAGKRWHMSSDDWTIHHCSCLITDAQSLRSLRGKLSMNSAAHNLHLHLEVSEQDDAAVHMSWVQPPNVEECEGEFGLWARLTWDFPLCTPFDLQQSSVLEEVLPGRSIPLSLAGLLQVPSDFGLHGAIILKKPPSWPASCPGFCFMVFDETSFDDEPGLGAKILQAYKARDLYVFQCNGAVSSGRSELNRSAVRLWANILMGRKSPDAQWPLGE